MLKFRILHARLHARVHVSLNLPETASPLAHRQWKLMSAAEQVIKKQAGWTMKSWRQSETETPRLTGETEYA